MRKVSIFKHERKEGETKYSLVPDGNGIFHCWGSNYEEFENGAGNFSSAIVERPNGWVINIPVEQIKFHKPIEGEGV